MHVPRSGTKTLRDRAKCCSRCLQETFLATTLKTGRGEACLIGQYICVLSYHNPYFLFVNVIGHLAYVLAPLTWPTAPCSCHGQLESNDVFILDRHWSPVTYYVALIKVGKVNHYRNKQCSSLPLNFPVPLPFDWLIVTVYQYFFQTSFFKKNLDS